jgi:nucleotide-binding universal stress UspA family protein
MVPEIKRILCATDLSENARYAFGYAVSLAKDNPGSLLLVSLTGRFVKSQPDSAIPPPEHLIV